MPARHIRNAQDAQLTFDWTAAASPPAASDAARPVDDKPMNQATTPADLTEPPRVALPTAAPLIQVLPWDFRTSFPQPLYEAIAAGKLHEDDIVPENLKSLHDEHANHALTLLADLDAVSEARRAGVDPRTGMKPRTPQQHEALQKLFEEEPRRLEQGFDTLIDVYNEAFGAEAAEAFRKAIRARHVGVEVIAEDPPTPRPLPEAIAAGVFGTEEDDTVVDPDSGEVQAIMENVTDKLAELPEGPERQALLSKCAEDFGDAAASELDRWSKLKPHADETAATDYDPGHPWHYYHMGDGAEPLALDSIAARTTALDQLGVKLPKNPTKRLAMLQKMLDDQRRQLAEDEGRYRDLVQRGVEALSKYDREIAHGGNDELAWASAVALKYLHITGCRGRVRCLEQQVGSANSSVLLPCS